MKWDCDFYYRHGTLKQEKTSYLSYSFHPSWQHKLSVTRQPDECKKCAPAVKPLQPLRQHCVPVHDCLCTLAQSSPHVSKARLNMKYCMFKCHHGKQWKHKSKCNQSWMYCSSVCFDCMLLLNHRHTASSPTAVERKVCEIAYSFKCKAHWHH